MEEQRLAAYIGLIEQMLRCPSGEEKTILNTNLELLDKGFVAMLRCYAEALRQQENPEAATFLENLADQFPTFLQGACRPQEPISMERQQAYGNLIQQLLACQAGDEQQILAEHSELLDLKFVQLCGQVAQLLEENNNLQSAAWLRSFAFQLQRDLPSAGSSSSSQEQQVFLMRMLQTVAEANGEDAIVYALLGDHLHHLNLGLADLLEQWFTRAIQEANLDKHQGLAGLSVTLGLLIEEFPFGNPQVKLEIALTAYTNALAVFTETDLPEFWISTNNSLGNTHCKLARLSENPKQHIIKSIEYYANALRICTVTDRPQCWANINMNLANAYSELAPFSESPNQQLEQAIKAYTNTLEILTELDMPDAWAKTTNNIAATYYRLARYSDDPKQLIENAIKSYVNALRIYTEDKRPQGYAMTNSNLGIAYNNLAPFSENPKQQIENAIKAYGNALRIYTEDKRPQGYAMTNSNLGIAYNNLAPFSENPKQQIENAIKAYGNALRIFTEPDYPQDWARSSINLGIAFAGLAPFSGKPKELLERAIDAYINSLRIFSEITLPEEWAEINNSLGSARANLAQFSENPKQELEKAVKAFENALRIYTEFERPQHYAGTNINLGGAFNDLAQYCDNPKQQIENAVNAYSNALRVARESKLPDVWAIINNNLGNAYSDLAPFAENPWEQIQNANAAFGNALKVRTVESRAADCLQTARNLGNLGFANNLPEVAIEGYSLAITAAENLRSAALDPARKAEIINQAIDVYAKLVQIYVDLGQYDKALEVADRSKARNLVELLATKDLYPKGEVPAEVISRLDALRGLIARTERQLNSTAKNRPFMRAGSEEQTLNTREINTEILAAKAAQASAERLGQLKQELNQLIEHHIQPIDPSFSLSQKVKPLGYEELRQTLPDDRTALVCWYAADCQLLAFIITRTAAQPHCLRYPDDMPEPLQDEFNAYLQAYGSNRSAWIASLPDRFARLSSLLMLDSIAATLSQLAPEVDQLILVPHRFLHLLPLHGLPLGSSDSTLLDQFARGVRFAPSLQVLHLLRQRSSGPLESLFAIANPMEDLPNTSLEMGAIEPLFAPQATVLHGKAASRANVEQRSASLATSHCLHFACHGFFHFSQPLLSALQLANCEVHPMPADADPDRYLPNGDGGAIDLHQCLTLLDLFQLDLRQARLVALSACETGLSELNSGGDEFVGLSTGFLFAGANSVIGSLWAVPDFTTGLLMGCFYRLLKAQTQQGAEADVALALKQAQHWLRQLSLKDLAAQRLAIPADSLDNFDLSLQHLQRHHSPEDQPFQSPYYWAAFTAVGQ
jgi:CHAT domain-containing protein